MIWEDSLKPSVLETRVLISLDALSVGTAGGDLIMYDLTKFQKLSLFEAPSGVNIVRFWDLQKCFLSSTVSGEMILNGFGNRDKHACFKVLPNEAINDFRILDEFNFLVGGNDRNIYQVDIRKGIIN